MTAVTAPSATSSTRVAAKEAMLSVKDLRTQFFTRRGVGKAVDGVTFELRRGEVLGLVGESGSGKSMTALSIMRLHPRPASKIVGGEILFDGVDLVGLSEVEMRKYRGSRISMVLQDPSMALNPVLPIGMQIEEPIRLHQGLSGTPLRAKAIEALQLLRIPDPERRLRAYPHQLSGGMRQRVVGAIALSCEPDLLIADEPTTALDATTQLAYLKVLKDIQVARGLGLLFITHDLGIVAKMCDRVAVMYAGKIVELGDVFQIFERPTHPYTQALLGSVPDVTVATSRLQAIEGQPPSIFELQQGCPFAARCKYAMVQCRTMPAETIVEPGHTASCWKVA